VSRHLLKVLLRKSSYEYPEWLDVEHQPDLVVLGCGSIGPQEQQVIERLLKHRQHLVVLCSTSVPRDVKRSLFLAGVADVTEKPAGLPGIVRIVEEALRMPRDNYEAVEQGEHDRRP